ncbi:uncharacterized protein LOC115622167 isoform X3 [Scaptodrosophila lebanonensis]|uniref:Uncharacterized protein LOC115622167 isoform X3 n=1 Tax=Drosophila lebanonensis TaxID=7225 RepID=A0A6J2TAB6_DROLE|nr:uncharacterized protein LOC115622167 isoform X3 [Scaptodrosophila lebanonensis]
MNDDDFVRGDVTDLSHADNDDSFSISVACTCMRVLPHRFDQMGPVIFTSKGVRISGVLPGKDEKFVLNIYKHEVIKVIAHFASNDQAQPLLTLYVLRKCAQYVKSSLNLPEEQLSDQFEFKSNGSTQHNRRLILLFDAIPFAARETIKAMFSCLDEIQSADAAEIFQRIGDMDRKSAEVPSKQLPPRQLRPDEQVNLLMYPPKGAGGLSIRMEDYVCLTKESYLNDIIIDFYLLWLRNTQISEAQRERTHIFSTFFYKRLTTLTRPTDMKQTAAQKRHARVQKWTKGVDLFEKDYIIVPINEQSHWFLAIICFPCLTGPVTFDTNVPVEPQQLKRTRGKKVAMQIGSTTITPLVKRESTGMPALPAEICRIGDDESERDEAEGDESDLASEDSENSNLTTPPSTSTPSAASKETTPTMATSTPARVNAGGGDVPAVKQPLILIFDSLAGASRSRVVATLRDYLTCEYKVKKPDAPHRVFNKDNMPGHCVKVPQQNNFTDCGLYLLQYVEQFFKEPIRDYRLPIKQLNNWFDLLTVTKKREDIALLIQQLMDDNNTQRRLILPVIEFPTLNGQLVEYPEEAESAEFEEEEGHEDEDHTSDMHDENNAPTDMEVDPTAEELQQAKTNAVRNLSTAIATTGSSGSSTATTSLTTTVTTSSTRRIVLKRRVPINTAVTTSGSNGSIGAICAGNGESPTVCSSPGLTSTVRLSAANPSVGQGSLKIRKIEP